MKSFWKFFKSVSKDKKEVDKLLILVLTTDLDLSPIISEGDLQLVSLGCKVDIPIFNYRGF